MHITLNILADYELLFDNDAYDEGHSIAKIQRMFVGHPTNALLNNFHSKENNNIKNNKLKKENFKHSAKFCICNLFFYKILFDF